MRADVTLVREPTDRTLDPEVFVRSARPFHRPVTRYDRVRIRSEKDVETARRAGVPIHLLLSERVSALGYPIRFPPRLVVPETFRPLVETVLPTLPFASERAARNPRPEDVAVAMLRVDMIGARALFDRNPKWDRDYILRRVWEEGLERRAAFVRFFDVLPSIPKTDQAIGRKALAEKLRRTPASAGRTR